MEYPSSIAAYGYACDEILAWMTDWISQYEFDGLVDEHNPLDKRLSVYGSETLVMPLWGDKHIFLLQKLYRYGIVEIKEDNGIVYYRRKEV